MDGHSQSPPRLAPMISIAGREVGPGHPCYVIAEAGSNHNRDLGMARELIDVAAEARADAVKFQTFTGKGLYSSKTPSFEYLNDDRSPQEILEELALPREWQAELRDHATRRGLHFLSTPFDPEAIKSLADLGVPALKIASFEIVDLPLIRTAAETGIPLIISTGMATYGEIEDALDAALRTGNRSVALLRCASLYPSPPEIMNLRVIKTLGTAFGVPAGLSDHTEGIGIAPAAVALGASLYEKHFTLSRQLEGPDHAFAIEPDELRQMVADIRAAEQALGNGRLEGPSDAEAKEMYRLARRSIVAARDIPEGTPIEREMLTTKRPGFGVAPKYMEVLVGRRAQVDIEFDDVITWDMV